MPKPDAIKELVYWAIAELKADVEAFKRYYSTSKSFGFSLDGLRKPYVYFKFKDGEEYLCDGRSDTGLLVEMSSDLCMKETTECKDLGRLKARGIEKRLFPDFYNRRIGLMPAPAK
jgi:hypothetical protein